MIRKRIRLVTVLITAAAAGLAGCTLIGYGVGALIDKDHAPGAISLRGVELMRLEAGQQVRLYFHDGREAAGKFEGLAPVSPEYATRYAAVRETVGPNALPALGESVELERSRGKGEAAVFEGFEPGAALVTRPKEAGPRSVVFADVARLAWSGGTADGDALTARMFGGKLPVRSRLVVDGQKIPIESVERIEVPRHHHSAAKTGAIIGAVLDVITVAFVIAAANETYGGLGTNTSSCPFVYAWDGHEYHREAEMYGGAILKSLARTDRAPLTHLQPVGGRVRLRVTNEQGEIDFLDRIGVVEVDVPEGATVVATPEGGLELLRSATSPLAAHDRRGRSVREPLQASDGQEWTSDPFGLDPDREGPRDELTLEFARPRGTRTVTLAFTLRSTPWGAGLLADLLRLQGRDLNVFYARLEEHPAERARFVAALAREGLPRVEVFDGRGWRLAGVLRNLGPMDREQAIRVALSGTPDDVLRVRLSATAGMWSVDRAVADFTPASPLQTRALRLVSAQDERNESVKGAIEGGDGRVHVLPPWSSSIELEFDAGVDRGPGRRVFAVEATGYYRTLLPARGAPQRALFDRLVEEPGAFGRYALTSLRREAVRQGAMAAP